MTQATGGAVSYYIRNNVVYKVHTFTTSGTLTVTETGNIDILAVAGGGAGHGYVGGGGGAGGLLYQTNLPVTSNLTITIGAGATGIQLANTLDAANSSSGGNTTVTGTGVSLTAIGGGGAGGYSDNNGTAGGSGGGCGGEQSGGATGGAGTSGQGNRGGNNVSGRSGNPSTGAGGGGAGAVGGNSLGAGNTTAGSGGAGKQEGVDFFIDGSGLWYAGGGGGGSYNAGTAIATGGGGGAGGGGGGGAFGSISNPGTGGIGRNPGGIGQGSDTAGRGGDGGANTGGGGGGVGHYSNGTNGRAGSGGSGIVILRYSFTPTGLTAVQNSATLTLNKFATNTSTAPVTGSGGSNVYSYSVSPALPSGLSINTSTGAITGQPQTAVTGVTYTVTVNDGFTSTANTFSLTTTTNLATTIEVAGGSIGYAYNSTRNTIYKIHTFTSSGNLVVTTPGTITVSAWGAGGGAGWTSGSGAGGGGAFVQGEFAASATSYGIVVGGGGLARANDAGTGTAPVGGGGLPGNSGYGGQGGGYSGFFATTTIGQTNALLIAGGGGGGSWEGRAGGAGGIAEGSPGQDGTTYGGRGGSQTAGGYSASGAGSALQGGNIGAQGDGGGGGGGGGGYFGGGGGTSDGTGSGGGGGSSYFAGNISATVASAGSGATAGGTTSIFYRSWGTGGASGSNNGNPGAVVISYPFDPSPLITTVATPSVTLNRWSNNNGVTPITVTGGLAPYYFTVSPDLPAGLHFNTATGQISGQPLVATAPTVYTVTVRDSTITLIGAPVNSTVSTFTLTTTITMPGAMTVSGGSTSTVSSNGLNYQVHTFTSSGNLTLGQTTTLEYLVVAGGGGGGGRHGGGGGGGGLVTSTVLLPAGTYPIIVGAGGAGAQTDTQGNDGFDSGIIQTLQHGSGEFDGKSSYVQLANSTALTLNAGAWTAECWINPTGDYSTYRTIFAKRASGSSSTAYEGYLRLSSGVVSFYNGTNYESSTTLTSRVWSHVAWVHNGTNIRIFVNGVTVLNVAAATNEINEPLVIGGARGLNEWFHGYISNLRIVKGTALYTADFTPPTAPLTAISGTSLLTLQHPTSWVDSSTNAAVITTSGTPVQSPFNPFNNLDASGGGGGGSYSSNTNTPGRVGGSGGGGGTNGAAGGAAWVGQGNSGGQGNGDEGGGGGGAATLGQIGVSGSYGGTGGSGARSNIDGLNYYYAAGGGGGSWQSQPGSGGLGGGGGGGGGETGAFGAGGTGGRNAGTAGIAGYSGAVNGGTGGANTGSGGGSSGQRDYQSYTGVGGNGGSGIVIIRYITGASALTTTKAIPKVLIGKYDNAPQTPVTPIGGTAPYTYSISPSLPEGLLFASGNGAIYGTPSVATYDTTYTVSITDSSAIPVTSTNTFVLSTSVSYQYAIDLVANKLLKITTEYGISDVDRRSAYIESPGAQIVTNNIQSNNKTLLHGNVLSISSQANITYGLGTDVTTTVTVPSTFNNYVNVGGNLKTYYGNIVANVSNFFLSNAFYGTAGTYTWTVPAGVTSISVAGVGGGGGGSQKASGGSGGAGAQLKYINNIPVTPGDTYTIVIGSGGSTGSAYGVTGGDTYMYKTGNTVPILLAAGGRGGDSLYWDDSTASVSIFDTPLASPFYRFSATSPVNETISYTVTSGSLPNGVTLNSLTGSLGGDPDTVTQTTTYTFTVSAVTTSQTISRVFSLIVAPLPDMIVTFSPSLNGISSWNFSTQGNLVVFYSNVSYTMTPQAPTEFDVKLWGGGGGGTTDGGIGGGGGYAAGRFSAALNVGYRLSIGQGGGGVVGNRNAGGGAAGTGIEFAGNSTPIIVAGGGGGGAQTGTGRAGAAGGGSSGGTAPGGGGAGGTQSAPGAGGNGGRRTGASGSGRNGGFGSTGSQSSRFAYGFGVGGWGSVNGGDAGSGGGGAGYFGGGEGGGDAGGFGGGGGSGYLHPSLVINGVLTAGSGQLPGNDTDTQRSLLTSNTEFGGNAGTGGIGGVIGSDGVNSSGFNGLMIISNARSTNPIGSLNNPAPSIASLRSAGITTDGPYWFSTTKQTAPFQAYVRFNYIDGGDWALLLKVHSQGDMPSGSTYWTNTTLYNPVDWNLTSGTWSKYATWNGIPFTRLMMVMTQGGTAKVPPIMIFNTSRTFAEAITLAGGATAASGQNNTVKADSTDPPRGNNVAYHNVSMKSGTAFTDAAGLEDQMQGYGIGMWANNASNSTTAEGFASTGRAGAWIGCPLDDQGHTFNNNHNPGADSGFGFGFAAGNGAKTGSAGYAEWTNASSTNTLPGYVWVR